MYRVIREIPGQVPELYETICADLAYQAANAPAPPGGSVAVFHRTKEIAPARLARSGK